MRRRLQLLLAVVMVTAVAPGTASSQSGSYRVYACGTTPSALTAVNNSWVAASSGIPAAQLCPASTQVSGLNVASATDSGITPENARGEWRLTAPADTTITDASLYRGLQTSLDDNWSAYIRSDQATLDECHTGPGIGAVCQRGQAGSVVGPSLGVYPGLNASWLAVGVVCNPGGGGCANGASLHYAFAALHQATVTLLDQLPPALGPRSGSLLHSTAWLRGPQSLTVGATDNGGGVSRIEVSSDSLSPIGWDAPCDQTRTVPCPLVVAPVTLTIDTGQLTDGSHQVTALARDVSGRESSVSWPIIVDNHAPLPPSAGFVEAPRIGSPLLVSVGPNPAGDPGSPIASVHWALTPLAGGTVQTGAWTGGLPTVTLPAAPAGVWSLRLWLEDRAGNVDPANAAQLTVDARPVARPSSTDSDGDGVVDSLDGCPRLAGVRVPGSVYNGCPRSMLSNNLQRAGTSGKWTGRYLLKRRAVVLGVRPGLWPRAEWVRFRKGTKVSPPKLVIVGRRSVRLLAPVPGAFRVPTRIEWRAAGTRGWRALPVMVVPTRSF